MSAFASLDAFPNASAAGQTAILAAFHRIARDGYPHLCPLRIGKNFGPAIETAVLRKLAAQGYSDGAPSPQLTPLGIEYAKLLL